MDKFDIIGCYLVPCTHPRRYRRKAEYLKKGLADDEMLLILLSCVHTHTKPVPFDDEGAGQDPATQTSGQQQGLTAFTGLPQMRHNCLALPHTCLSRFLNKTPKEKKAHQRRVKTLIHWKSFFTHGDPMQAHLQPPH